MIAKAQMPGVCGKLILASASPRRAKILAGHGIDFEVFSSSAPEVSLPFEPERTVMENARTKLAAARKLLLDAGRRDFCGVLAADTIVWFDNRIYGKPQSEEEAAEFLRELSGKSHTVFTGVAFADANGKVVSACEESRVTFHELSDEKIAEYVARVRPLDRAGAYDIDESGDLIVSSYSGEYDNIMGLPYKLVEKLLSAAKEG